MIKTDLSIVGSHSWTRLTQILDSEHNTYEILRHHSRRWTTYLLAATPSLHSFAPQLRSTASLRRNVRAILDTSNRLVFVKPLGSQLALRLHAKLGPPRNLADCSHHHNKGGKSNLSCPRPCSDWVKETRATDWHRLELPPPDWLGLDFD